VVRQFRNQGGHDSEENLITLCAGCHSLSELSLLQGNVLLLLLRIHTYLQGGGSRFLGDTDLPALCLPFRSEVDNLFPQGSRTELQTGWCPSDRRMECHWI